jgi:hypothetical protein
MVLMERIVRQHLPVDSGASKTAAKCQTAEPNNIVKLAAPSQTAQKAKQPTETSKTSSWSYGYKKYMEKKEKEEDKCKQGEQVVGSSAVTGQKIDTQEAPENTNNPTDPGFRDPRTQ